MSISRSTVAVVYQELSPPLIDGFRKPKKDTGYRDSGADIAFALRQRGIPIVTPVIEPDPRMDADWVFADTDEGMNEAVEHGAEILWLNTVLFEGHPAQRPRANVRLVGQRPSCVHRYDDKWVTNHVLREHGCPVPRGVLVGTESHAGAQPLASLDDRDLEAVGMPCVLKPVRGRGSQGVVVARSPREARRRARALLEDTTALPDGSVVPTYGRALIIEPFLPGLEITITVMPPGTAWIDGRPHPRPEHWVLPPVERWGHEGGIAPYCGTVPVSHNSRAIPDDRRGDEILRAQRWCIRAAQLVGARAPIRIDCRADDEGHVHLFDLNLKPNMTGAGRPGRADQDSLTCIAARALGMSYPELLLTMLDSAWTPP